MRDEECGNNKVVIPEFAEGEYSGSHKMVKLNPKC